MFWSADQNSEAVPRASRVTARRRLAGEEGNPWFSIVAPNDSRRKAVFLLFSAIPHTIPTGRGAHMHKVFVGFDVSETLSPIMRDISELVQRHHGSVVRRTHPPHVTVMTPRFACQAERESLKTYVEEFNATNSPVFCRLDSFRRLGHGKQQYFVIETKDRSLAKTITAFHLGLERRLNWERQRYEGRRPHITLISSKHLDTTRTFKRVVKDALTMPLPIEHIELPRLFIHVEKGRRHQEPKTIPVEDSGDQGWYP